MTSPQKSTVATRRSSMSHVSGAIDRLLLVGLLFVAGTLLLMFWPDASKPPGSSETPAAATPDSPRHFLITGAQLFDGERTWPRADVEVNDGMIVAVAESLDRDASIERIDANGMTLLPGLVDAHVHVYGTAREQMLRFGVTSAIDMFSDPAQLPSYRADRESVDNSTRADVWSAGALLTAEGGHGTQFGTRISTLDRAEDAAQLVEERREQGSDFIKFVVDDGHTYGRDALPTLDSPRVDALIAASRAAGLATYAHIADVDTAISVIAAGADGLVHVFSDREATPAEIEAIARGGTAVIPTLSVISVMSNSPNGAELLKDETIAPWLSATQKQQLDSRFGGMPTNDDQLSSALANTLALHRAGALVLAGTDVGNPGTAAGASMHGELELLVRAGFTASEALAAATSKPAQEFGLSERGRIAPAMRADLLLVEGDPLSDIRQTRHIHGIWKNGVRVDRRASLETSESGGSVDWPILSTFDTGSTAASHGLSWLATTDQMIGGKSSVVITNSQPDAASGTLSVSGKLEPGAAYPWSGAMLMLRDPPMQPVDASALRSIRFRLRGDPRELNLMLFSGEQQAPPAISAVSVTSEWQSHVIKLDSLHGVDRQRLRAIAFTAGMPMGTFAFELDDVELSATPDQ